MRANDQLEAKTGLSDGGVILHAVSLYTSFPCAGLTVNNLSRPTR